MTCFEFVIGKRPSSLAEDTYVLVVCKGMSILAIRAPKITWETFANIINLVEDLRRWLLKEIADEKLYGALFELKLVLIFTPIKPDPLSYKALMFAENVIKLPIKTFIGFYDIHASFSDLLSIPGMV